MINSFERYHHPVVTISAAFEDRNFTVKFNDFGCHCCKKGTRNTGSLW